MPDNDVWPRKEHAWIQTWVWDTWCVWHIWHCLSRHFRHMSFCWCMRKYLLGWWVNKRSSKSDACLFHGSEIMRHMHWKASVGLLGACQDLWYNNQSFVLGNNSQWRCMLASLEVVGWWLLWPCPTPGLIRLLRCHAPNRFGTVNMEDNVNIKRSWCEGWAWWSLIVAIYRTRRLSWCKRRLPMLTVITHTRTAKKQKKLKE